ncbi:MAG: hypothetical protein SX243_07060 [Acidobacteriota bacterium]|nr:hypothetical protein [Acidobacteriota bacterium]
MKSLITFVLLTLILCIGLVLPAETSLATEPAPAVTTCADASSTTALASDDAMLKPPAVGGESATWLSSPCTVTRYCQDPPPTYVTCTSQAGNCTLGPTYVICDGNRYDCPVCSPQCDDIDGTSCGSGSTYCQRNVGGECFSYLCTCFSGKWRCAGGW